MDDCKPDFARAATAADEILIESRSVATFPFSVTKLIAEMSDIVCCSYARAARHGVDAAAFGSESAALVECDGRHLIFYNETESERRVRFSMLHELGHYMLRHDMETKDAALYARQEKEANCFAAELLMPEVILKELIGRGFEIDLPFLTRAFDVSASAATARMGTMEKRLPYLVFHDGYYDDILLQKYKCFVDALAPRNVYEHSLEWEYDKQAERDRWYF